MYPNPYTAASCVTNCNCLLQLISWKLMTVVVSSEAIFQDKILADVSMVNGRLVFLPPFTDCEEHLDSLKLSFYISSNYR